MALRTKTFKWILRLLALSILFLAILLLSAPRILNSDYVRLKLQTLASEHAGIQLDYQSIKVRYTPHPSLQIDQLKVDIPEIITIAADTTLLSTGLMELLTGKNLIDRLQIEKPDVTLYLPHLVKPSPDPISEDELWAILSNIIDPLITLTPDLNIGIVEGRFDLADTTYSPFSVQGIDAELLLNDEADGLNVELSGEVPRITLNIHDEPTDLSITDLSVSSHLEAKSIKLRLNHLLFEKAGLEFTGDFRVQQPEPKLYLQLGTHVPDLIKILPFIKPFLADIQGVDQVFDSILAGTISNITVDSTANSIADLMNPDGIKVDAHLENGEFYLSRLSHHVKNVSGRLRIADRRIELSDTHVESGRSVANIEMVAIHRKSETTPFLLDMKNTNIHFDLKTLYNNLTRLPAIDKQLSEISSLEGTLNFNLLSLNGPLADMSKWRFKATGSISGAAVSTGRFPEPIAVSSGSYAWEPRHFTFKDLHVKAMASELNLSGAVLGRLTNPSHIWTSVNGMVSSRSINWVREQVNRPDFMPVVTPITIHRSTLSWKSGNNITAKGAFNLLNGPEFDGEMSFSPPKNLQATLSLVDHSSKATVSVGTQERFFSAAFSGHLSQDSINSIYSAIRPAKGHLSGDFALDVTRDAGVNISTSGTLQGEDLLLPIGISEPLQIMDLKLAGHGETLAIDRLALTLGGERAEMTGEITNADNHHALNLTLRTGPLDILRLKQKIETIQNDLPGQQSTKEAVTTTDKKTKRHPLPLSGRIGLEIDELSLKHLSISPFQAEINFAPGEISAQINKANLCGVDLLGSVLVTSEYIDLKLPINAVDEDLLKGSVCLTGESSQVTGRYDLSGSFIAQEPLNDFLESPGELIKTIKGEINLNARDGAVEQSVLASRLLSVINLTEAYDTDYLSLDKSKLGYKAIQIEGVLEQGRMKVPKLHFNGTTLEIIGDGYIDLQPSDFNIELLVAPLKTVDTVVKWLPGINYLLAGNLVTVPVRLSGPVDDINIRVIPVGSIGQRTLGLFERIVKIPVKIVEPLTGDVEEDDSEPEAP